MVRSTTEFADYDANYVGGDILTGAKDPLQLIFGPRMSGANAAASALRYLRRIA